MVVVKKNDGTPIAIRMHVSEFFKALTDYDGIFVHELVFDNGVERVFVDLADDRFSYLGLEGDSVEITTDAHINNWYDGYKADNNEEVEEEL